MAPAVARHLFRRYRRWRVGAQRRTSLLCGQWSLDRTWNTSSSGRRGVAGGTSSMAGAMPTRIRTWAVVFCPISLATRCRLARSSVTWVSVHVASPAMVASSSTAESVSPHFSTLRGRCHRWTIQGSSSDRYRIRSADRRAPGWGNCDRCRRDDFRQPTPVSCVEYHQRPRKPLSTSRVRHDTTNRRAEVIR